jgi:hypothetical protein
VFLLGLAQRPAQGRATVGRLKISIESLTPDVLTPDVIKASFNGQVLVPLF